MQTKHLAILLTLIVWLAIILALGFWRLVYAWHVGNFLEYISQDWPRMILILIVVLVCEYFYFRDR
jgi:hypothetical protein